MKVNLPQYIPGAVKLCCDRCGFIRRRGDLRMEWTGNMVCAECWDPRPAHLDAPNVYAEGLPIPNARPEPPATELSDGDPITGADL